MTRPQFHYRLFGHFERPFGLSQAAHLTLRGLREAGRSFEAHQLGSARRFPLRLLLPPRNREASGTHVINLLHANPTDLHRHPAAWSALTSARDYNVAVPFWELPRLPPNWVPWLRAMDAVLAPSRFIADACRADVAHERVVEHPLSVWPERVAPRRADWGLEPGATVFALVFDWLSDPERKNPALAIRAFQQAFPDESDVALLIKVSNLPAAAPGLDEFRQLVSGDARLRVVDRTLPREELLGLVASADAMLSLHRAEGLGLHLLEAMGLGVPVVATAYSGNLDFMTEENSWLVRFRLVPPQSSHPSYAVACAERDQHWAEPDLEDAVAALREVRERPELRRRKSEFALRTVAARAMELASGESFERLEQRLLRVSPNGTEGLFRIARREVRDALADAALRGMRRLRGAHRRVPPLGGAGRASSRQ